MTARTLRGAGGGPVRFFASPRTIALIGSRADATEPFPIGGTICIRGGVGVPFGAMRLETVRQGRAATHQAALTPSNAMTAWAFCPCHDRRPSSKSQRNDALTCTALATSRKPRPFACRVRRTSCPSIRQSGSWPVPRHRLQFTLTMYARGLTDVKRRLYSLPWTRPQRPSVRSVASL